MKALPKKMMSKMEYIQAQKKELEAVVETPAREVSLAVDKLIVGSQSLDLNDIHSVVNEAGTMFVINNSGVKRSLRELIYYLSPERVLILACWEEYKIIKKKQELFDNLMSANPFFKKEEILARVDEMYEARNSIKA